MNIPHRPKLLLVIVGLSTAFLLVSCSLFSSTDTIPIVLPVHPFAKTIGHPESWTVTWFAPTGVRTATLTSPESPTLNLAREFPLIVTAQPNYPHISAYWTANPAGAVINPAGKRISLFLKWEDGFSARMLLNLAKQGLNVQRINVERLAVTITERISPNPWRTDQLNLSAAILDESLWVYSIKKRPAYKKHLDLPHGTWLTEYPLNQPIVADEDGWSGELTEGLHNLLQIPSYTVISVWVEPKAPPVLFKGAIHTP